MAGEMKYTHVIRHYSPQRTPTGERVAYNYLAANVRRTESHICYESMNAWGNIVTTRVPIHAILNIELYEEEQR